MPKSFLKGEGMYKYTKIETPFKRDMGGSKDLMEGIFRDEAVEYLKDCQWTGTEKVDGTNISVFWDGHSVSFYGRTERAQIPTPLLDKLYEMFGGDTNEELFEQMFGEKGVVFYGEGYGPKIQKGGGLYRDDVSFIMFDVYLPQSNLWLKREAIEEIAKAFNVEVVPIVFRGTLEEAVAYVKTKPLSLVAKNHSGKDYVMEGIVCKPNVELMTRMGERIIVKVKVKDFC
jgi:hypothetical protein